MLSRGKKLSELPDFTGREAAKKLVERGQQITKCNLPATDYILLGLIDVLIEKGVITDSEI